MERKNKITVLILVIILAISILILNAPLYKQTIPTKFIAGENSGFDLGPGNLNFGKIIPGQSVSREITITNEFDKSTITKIEASGEVSSCIIVSENNFILQPEESKDITFSCFPKLGIELKEYVGEITITTKKASFF
jgi:hypothetical protein